MTKFIKKTVLFIAASAFILLAIILIPNYVISKRSRFAINNKDRIVLFGHSHPECAFDDTLISNLKNLSHSAEPYFYTYQKVKMVLQQNPQIETVLVEFTNNQIDAKMNDWTWGYTYMSSMFPKYIPFMDKADIGVLAENNPKDFMNCLSVSARNNLVRVLTSDYEFTSIMGGYFRIDASRTSLTADSISSGQGEMVRPGVSLVNLLYLKKIIAFCRERHKRVFLVRSPQHHSYEYLKNEKDFLRIKQAMFSSTEFLDFGKFPLRDDEFADFGHLNYKGATKFSKWFGAMLNSGLLKTVNKQLFIDQSISGITTRNETFNRTASR
ncbi:hypothetical protein [Mucilaginibacter sp. L3T2-6]|uniref:hypothetical protein n=1 Tax=Mucilaginibacter sp. L3T2-6 TaxID=3062491 RepID=UPI00267609A1|nr:hypothetical protein [Mucilaginibacter sp. L3T2-6]MDO3644433.1 hypothetical protein [Mucilaginibacter sp. L3T2-6]MDV6216885.1 hypothetical protein [Mucilaginibacter sp. L3T2-6]